MEQDNDEIPDPSNMRETHLEENQTFVLTDVFMPTFRDKMATKAVNYTVKAGSLIQNTK